MTVGAPAALGGGMGDALVSWLAHGLPEARPPFRATRISGGHSMLTWRIDDEAGNAWALRHPPAGHHAHGAHDVAREARAMRALAPTPVPVPAVRLLGTADDPLGVPCHVTDFVAGHVVANASDAASLSRASRARASLDIVSVLAALHAVDPDAVGLGDLGPRTGIAERHLHRWTGRVAAATPVGAEDVAASCLAVAAELQSRLPAQTDTRIVHGDYRLGNAVVGDDGSVRAVLDWELVTLGAPLADLGILVAYWCPPPDAMLGVSAAHSLPGPVPLSTALDHYATLTGADLASLDFYYRLACWRVLAMVLTTWSRYDSGAMGTSQGIPPFADAARVWLDRASRPLDSDEAAGDARQPPTTPASGV